MDFLKVKSSLKKAGIEVKNNKVKRKDLVKVVSTLRNVVKAREGRGLKETHPEWDTVVHNAIKDATDELESKYELYTNNVEEIEHKSRDGFISSNDGGYDGTGFTDIAMLQGTGRIGSLPAKAQKALNEAYDQGLDDALKEFKEKNKEELKGIPDDKINYADLGDLGRSDLAEELSEYEREFTGGENDTVMFLVRGMFHAPDSLTVQVVCNWEAPYHRPGKQWEDFYEKDFDFKDTKDLKAKLDKCLKEGLSYMGIKNKK